MSCWQKKYHDLDPTLLAWPKHFKPDGFVNPHYDPYYPLPESHLNMATARGCSTEAIFALLTIKHGLGYTYRAWLDSYQNGYPNLNGDFNLHYLSFNEPDIPEGFHIDDLLYDGLVVDDPSTYPYIVPTPVYPEHEAPLYEVPPPGSVSI